jgi:hypothetical protein
MHGRVDVEIHVFLTLSFTLRPLYLFGKNPSTLGIGGCVVPRTGFENMEK